MRVVSLMILPICAANGTTKRSSCIAPTMAATCYKVLLRPE